MKKVVMGGFLSLIGSIWALAVWFAAQSNLVDSWHSPPGRFLSTVSHLGLLPFFVVSLLLVGFGLAVLLVAGFRKGD